MPAAPRLLRVKVLFVLLGLAEAALLPFIPLYLKREEGFSAQAIGAVLAVMALAAFLASPLWGYLADRWLGTEPTLVLTAAASAGLAWVLYVPSGRAAFVLIATLLWVVRSPLTGLVDSLALERLGPRRRAYGSVRLWQSAGWAVAVLLWGLLLQEADLRLLPALYGVTVPLVALWAHFALGGGRRAVRAPAAERRRLPRAEVFPLALVGFLVSLLLLNASFTATWNFLTLRIAGLGGGLFLIGVAASLQAFAEIPAFAAMPRLMALLSHRALYVVGCAVYVAVFLAWAVLTDPLAISLIKIVIGVGYALTYVGSVVIVDDLVPGHLRATGQGLGKSMLAVAPVVGTLGGGLLYGLVSPATMFVAAAAATTAAGALAWLVVRTPRAEETGPAGLPTGLEQSARRV